MDKSKVNSPRGAGGARRSTDDIAIPLVSVNIRKRAKNWYVFVTHYGRRIARSVGPSKQRAEQLRRELEARLVLGDLGIFGLSETDDKQVRTFDSYSQLRLMGLRDTRLLAAMMNGKTSIADELVFPSHAGTVLKPDNIAPRYMEPALREAGLGHSRFHDLRHSFGSLLIQDGASLTYVKEQMGHGSIQITVDVWTSKGCHSAG